MEGGHTRVSEAQTSTTTRFPGPRAPWATQQASVPSPLGVFQPSSPMPARVLSSPVAPMAPPPRIDASDGPGFVGGQSDTFSQASGRLTELEL